MNNSKTSSAWVLGICLLLGLSALGYLLGDAAIRYKEYERTVTVKGLSEREYPADIVIWPIQFTTAARAIGLKFANDSNSTLGKIRKASQGQFSIEPRDTNNPQIKKVRVVSTVEYYLSD